MVGARQEIPVSKQGKKSVLVPVLPVRDAVHFPRLINTLHVAREPSLRALRRSMDHDRLVLALSQRDMALEEPHAADLFRVGTLSETLQAVPMPDASVRVALRGLRRVRATKIVSRAGAFWAEIEAIDEIPAEGVAAEALMRAALDEFRKILELSKTIPREALQSVAHLDSAGAVADAIAHHLPVRFAQKQELLETLDADVRLRMVLELLKREEQVLTLNADIHLQVERELGDTQREYYLREQLRIIEDELHVREDRVGEIEDYRARIESAGMTGPALEKALVELRRLDRTPVATPEGMVLRNYLDTLISMPWATLTEDTLDLALAEEVLGREHFGLDAVKGRVLEHLAVRKLKGDLRGPILCFVGPPGVGKTSIGRAIAEAMGRKFVRLSLGGVRDEAEIRGHRRTYVGSMPGRIVESLRQCGTRNPVFMLDEIDKLGSDYRGDPTSALLEVLDPEQNSTFSDHYLESPFDLSTVLFIATANSISGLAPALRDRMEVVQFSGYSDEERLEIAKRHLLPHVLAANGVGGNVKVQPQALATVVRDYTRESGVRDLERQIATLVRKSARRIASGETRVSITAEELPGLLGRTSRPPSSRASLVGSATGLVVAEYGGDIIAVEASLMEPIGPKPELRLTGNMGQVMRESAEAALTFIRSHQAQLSAQRFAFDVHVHVPEAGIPKDGPSAGLTIAVALASAFTGRAVRGEVAMTGEISLSGRVLAVGGIREKVLAAHRAGIRELILPAENEADLADVPASVREAMVFHTVRTLPEALAIALAPNTAVVMAE